ncbi:MAG: prephenate dehydrogenase [Gammaproteobacteria bacterium WSBS_2016_MAG_OTU1]
MRTLAVIGLGLIGGSFARAGKAAGMRVIGVDCCEQTLKQALTVLDEVSTEVAASTQADEILIATPVGTFGDIFTKLEDSLEERTTVFDAGSCKRQVIELATDILGDKVRRFVPSHPIAGGEDSGFLSSSAELFQGRNTIVCPANADLDAVERTHLAWRRVGAQTTEMSAEEHDEIFATVSHLPHILSFALVESIRAHPQKDIMLKYAAGGFRDFTRIAASHPTMWSDICQQNGDDILAAIADFRVQLAELETAIKSADGDFLENKFAAARDLRRTWRKTLED